MVRRHTALLLAACLTAVAVLGTSGFSAASADRSVSVVVAEDSNAYLGFQQHNQTLSNGHHTVALLTLTNQLTTRLTTIDVRVRDGSPTPPNYKQGSVSEPDELSVGESEDVTARITCSNSQPREEIWTVRVAALGKGTEVRLDRQVRITCSGSPKR